MRSRVYVDAKIEGIQDPKLPRTTYVAYVVENVPGLQGFDKVDANETDDAELHAIAFAIQRLKGKLDRFTVFSDHESAVFSQRQRPLHTKGRPRLHNDSR